MAVLQLKDPLELFVKGRKFPPGSGFLSRRKRKQHKTHSFLPSFLLSFGFYDRFLLHDLVIKLFILMRPNVT